MIALVYPHISASWATLFLFSVAAVICYNTVTLKSVTIYLGNDPRILLDVLTLRRLMSYIYGAPILDVSRSHTTTQHSR